MRNTAPNSLLIIMISRDFAAVFQFSFIFVVIVKFTKFFLQSALQEPICSTAHLQSVYYQSHRRRIHTADSGIGCPSAQIGQPHVCGQSRLLPIPTLEIWKSAIQAPPFYPQGQSAAVQIHRSVHRQTPNKKHLHFPDQTESPQQVHSHPTKLKWNDSFHGKYGQ